MDPLAALLDGPRAHGAFLLRSVLTPPWSLRIEDEAPLTVVSVVRGEAWIVPDTGDGVLLGENDVAIVRGRECCVDRRLARLLFAALGAWSDGPATSAPAWSRAHDDPVVGQALRLLQHQPAEPWTVAKLAADVGVSRAALARRFAATVG